MKFLSRLWRRIAGPTREQRAMLVAIRAEMEFLKPIMDGHFRKMGEAIRASDWDAYDVELRSYHVTETRWRRNITEPLEELQS